ncbi:MAG TPA: DNA methyltransferase [Myxococcota bacterium]|nr:DNA methyltransferase [Myxococcota bacterium]
MTISPQGFIERWKPSGSGERGNCQPFLSELCVLLELVPPDPKKPVESENAYVFDKAVPLPHGETGFIDLYKRGCFVLEAKQGSDKPEGEKPLSEAATKRQKTRKKGTAVRGTGGWDTTLEKAKQQAQNYARGLPPEELTEGGRPPFLVVLDIGYTIDLYAEFTRSGGHYVPFPDPSKYRFKIDDLAKPEVRELLKQVWTDPNALDPALHSARVTREIADRLARLSQSLEGQHDPAVVASFLMRALFTMFAEDVGLLPELSFTKLLEDLLKEPESFKPLVEQLWKTMNKGGLSGILHTKIPRFNGGLFEDVTALALNRDQIELLSEAARADWREVEPAIFGTLLERALNPLERHKLGAHYTPRAYVERLVEPTIMKPMRGEWEAVKTAAVLLAEEDGLDKALAQVDGFLQRLATTRVLDPACGSGNFLYVTLAKMKELEAEVLDVRFRLGGTQMAMEMESVRVTPQQFLGIEVNPRAAAIAELVLWIGYLQWHIRTYGRANPPDPVLKAYHNIECRDAVLAWDAIEPLLDEEGQPVTRRDGSTSKTHPVTGKQVPDVKSNVPICRYVNPRPSLWPQVDFIIGNPPFIGGWLLRQAKGDGYVEALWKVYPDIPQKADYVMYWWDRAASAVSSKQAHKFGLISTNSIKQIFQRRVIEHHTGSLESPIVIEFAIADHPWVDSGSSAAVRIAMTVGTLAPCKQRRLGNVVNEGKSASDTVEIGIRQVDAINSDLSGGANLDSAEPLLANEGLCSPGVQLYGMGFVLEPQEAQKLFSENESYVDIVHPYINGRDLMGTSRNCFVIDFFGYSADEASRRFPEAYQRVLNLVKPQREKNRRDAIRKKWWRFGWERPAWRSSVAGLKRFISTSETSKHRVFVFVDAQVLPDNRLVNFAFDEAYYLGVLSSKVHVTWALAAGGTLEDRPIYNKTRCFEPFTFPKTHKKLDQRISALAEQIDAHRKVQQSKYQNLTLTGIYNVLEKLRNDKPLSEKEHSVHEQGLVSVLKELHDELDRAVLDAYGWPHDITAEEILERLVALNAVRAAEEANGLIRWLRPEFQAPSEKPTQQKMLDEEPVSKPKRQLAEAPTGKRPWPSTLAEQAQAIRDGLATLSTPVNAKEVAAGFIGRATKKRVAVIEALLETLVTLGQARKSGHDRFFSM